MKKLLSIIFVIISTPALSYDWVVNTKITIVEPTYVPDKVKIQISEDGGPCKAGTWLTWIGKSNNPEANVEAIYSAALSSLMANKTVRLYGEDSCLLQFMHVHHD